MPLALQTRFICCARGSDVPWPRALCWRWEAQLADRHVEHSYPSTALDWTTYTKYAVWLFKTNYLVISIWGNSTRWSEVICLLVSIWTYNSSIRTHAHKSGDQTIWNIVGCLWINVGVAYRCGWSCEGKMKGFDVFIHNCSHTQSLSWNYLGKETLHFC